MKNIVVDTFKKHPVFFFFLIVQLLMRTLISIQFTELTAIEIGKATLIGLVYDLFICGIIGPPLGLLSRVTVLRLPLLMATVSMTLFVAMAEWNFWNEFHSRFNFIAVDYLIYSKEVLNNLLESFPLVEITSAILLMASLITFFIVRYLPQSRTFSKVALALPLLYFLLPFTDVQFQKYPQEQISRNSYLEFYRAYRSNRISYNQFYKTVPVTEMNSYAKPVHAQGKNEFTGRLPNVVVIIQESLGAKFIRPLGGQEDTTPFLNALAEKSLFFTKLFSTGTRTVRGLEAISLSVPPTPGYAVVKRPQDEGIASIGSVFKAHNYQMKFLYGGYGYFDNMNAFYENLGLEVIDKNDFSSEEITFSNAWGACDEDLYHKAIKLADFDSKANMPFLHVMLTTSNHRPFTYPEGKIDIPSGSERKGAVKYTDYALSEFFEEAEKKPWFKNTLFVIVADHSTEGRGVFNLDMNDFHIPMWIYSPGNIAPGKINTLGSQVDVLPTILGILGWTYEEPFFGEDLRVARTERAFIGNYQQVGYYEEHELITLSPNRIVDHYFYDADSKKQQLLLSKNDKLENKAAAFYQYASYLLDNHLYRAKSAHVSLQSKLSKK